METEDVKQSDGDAETLGEAEEVRVREGLPLPVREPLGQWDTEGEVVAVKHRLGEPVEELEWEGE